MIIRGIDLGGSEVRLATKKNNIYKFDAKCLEIEANAPVKSYLASGANPDVLCDFVIRKHPMSQLNGRRFVRNEAIDNYSGRILYCDSQDVKVKQEITYINLAFALAMEAYTNYHNDDEVTIAACIPTSEYYSEGDLVSTFKRNATGNYEIYFPLCDKTINFTIPDDNVRVTPEGVVAALQFRMVKSFREGVTLIVDVGKRSTDITLLKNMKALGNSAVSRPKGGLNIEAYVKGETERDGIMVNTEQVEKLLATRYIIRDNNLEDVTELVSDAAYDVSAVEAALKSKYDDVTLKDVDDAMNRYYVRYGTEIIDLTKYVTAAKKVFCSSLKTDITDVLARGMFNVQAVNNIVPIGRVFTGDIKSENNMVNILLTELNCKAVPYMVGNLSTANVSEIMAVFGD